MRLRSIAAILKECSELATVNERIEYLQKNQHPVMLMILKYAYDPSIVFILPEGAPPYKPCEFLDQEGRLYTEARKLYLFIEGGNPNLNKVKREMLFIQLIESLDKRDAELLISIKEKKLPFKGITEKIVKAAFPGLLPVKEQND